MPKFSLAARRCAAGLAALLIFLTGLSGPGVAVTAQARNMPGAMDADRTIYLPALMTEASAAPEPTPGPTPGGGLSPEARIVVIEEVEEVVNTLLPPVTTPVEARDFYAEVALLGEELLKLDGIVATLVSTSTLTVQAVMADGISISIVNNRPTALEYSGPAAELAAATLAQQSVGPAGLAENRRAVVANFDGGGAVAAEVRRLLQDAGYQVLNLGASISSMRQYKNLGVLYLDTHGVQYQQFSISAAGLSPGPLLYALQTSTEVSIATLKGNFDQELNNGEVILSLGEDGPNRQVKFAITEKFIAKHWSFEKGVVMIHACFGGAGVFIPDQVCLGSGCSPNAPGALNPPLLRAAMKTKGATVVASFDNYTNTDQARTTILHFFDRLLGADTINRLTPPARPFALDEVRKDMVARNLITFDMPSFIFAGINFGDRTADLTFDASDPQAALAPTIESIEVVDDSDKPQGEVKLKGAFGTRQGSATIDNRPTTVAAWSAGEIVLNTPFSGSGAAGDVIVQAPDQVESNPVPLTEWQGTVKLIFTPGQGTLQATATMDVRFRADLHKSRAMLDAPPTAPTQQAYLTDGGNSEVTASGVYNDPDEDLVTTYMNGGDLSAFGKTVVDIFAQTGAQAATVNDIEQAGNFGGIITLDPSANRATLCLTLTATHKVRVQSSEASQTYDSPLLFLGIDGLSDSMRGALACYNLTLNADYTIPAGVRTQTLDEATFRIEWSRFAPVAPPTEKTPG
jgi:hypothetical protein